MADRPICGHPEWVPACTPCQTRHLSPEQSEAYTHRNPRSHDNGSPRRDDA